MKYIQVYQNSIHIINDRYKSSVTHIGTNRHPNIDVEYVYLQYCDNMLHESFWVDKNNSRQSFDDSQIEILDELVAAWEQEIGQEGNPSTEQIKEQIKLVARQKILEKYPLEKQSSTILGIYGDTYLTEMKNYISSIIDISNEAELNDTSLEDIQWSAVLSETEEDLEPIIPNKEEV